MIRAILGKIPLHANYYLKKHLHRPIAPRHIDFDVTERCNLKCSHCPYSTFRASELELSISEICAGFTSLLKLSGKLPYVSLSGGEPMLKKGLAEFIDFLERHHFPWGLITNGTCTSSEILHKLSSYRHLQLLRTSLDGLQENHDILRGSPGSFDKTLGFIKEARKSCHVLRVNFTVNALNIGDIVPVASLATSLGCDEIYFNLIGFYRQPEKIAYETELRDRFQEKEKTCGITLKDERLLTPDIKRLWESLRIAKKLDSIKVVVTPDLSLPKLHDYFCATRLQRDLKCFFPWYGIRLDPSGNVYPCPQINLALGNIRTTPLLEIFNGAAFEEFRSRFKGDTLTICHRCSCHNGRLNCRNLIKRIRGRYH